MKLLVRYLRCVRSAGLAPGRAFRQRSLRRRGVRQGRHPPPLADHVAGVYQDVDAVGAQHADDDGAYRPHGVARVGEGVRHGQDTSAQAAFE